MNIGLLNNDYIYLMEWPTQIPFMNMIENL